MDPQHQRGELHRENTPEIRQMEEKRRQATHEETCNKKEQLVPLVPCKVVFKPALVVFVTLITT